LVKKFISLGNEYVEFLKAARSSHGKLFAILCILFAYPCTSITRLLSFLSPSCAADDLAAANARISSLEAKLEASRKAWDTATAAKTTAEKSHKSALARAKKAEKALADANKERIQRDQAVTERLNKISALAGGKCHALPFFVELRKFLYSLICALFPVFASLVACRTYWSVFGISTAGR
jgi:septal ring factor EnvC (AmiA/AmiB activator)